MQKVLSGEKTGELLEDCLFVRPSINVLSAVFLTIHKLVFKPLLSISGRLDLSDLYPGYGWSGKAMVLVNFQCRNVLLF